MNNEIKEKATGPRRAGEFLVSKYDRFPPRAMFGSFWREGELALMFGAAGVGKSLLAVQLGDAMARGRAIVEGIEMPRSHRKVLYVDLRHSDRQFAERYSYRVPTRSGCSVLKACKFAENLYRSRPPANDQLCEWVAGQIAEHRFAAVIVDDLTALKKTHDGVREMLSAMRKLKQICDDQRVSILAIACSGEPLSGRTVSESDLKRSSVLCSVADSVFAIGRGRAADDGGRYIVQTRSRNAPLDSTVHNALSARIARAENGWPGFVFDERFTEPVDPETRDTICRVRAMRRAGKTWRAISEELGIPKTRAVRLFKKWTPEMGEYVKSPATAEFEGVVEPEQPSSPPYEGGVSAFSADGVVLSPSMPTQRDSDVDDPEFERTTPSARKIREHPPLLRKEGSLKSEPPRLFYGPERVSIYDLERRTDGGGEEIFVESFEEHSRKPMIWYKRDRRGETIKYVRNHLGSRVVRLGPSAFL